MKARPRSTVLAGACLAGFLLMISGPLAVPARAVPLGPAPTGGGPTPVSVALGGAPATIVGPEFWGADVRPYYSLGTSADATYHAAGLSVVRWPGGAIADRLNVTTNRIYNDNGTYSTPTLDESQFVSWCRSVSCTAVLGLPGEIDSPSTAAYYVEYTEQSLHFTPEFWEIGNEPALWTHFGTGWAQWNTSQSQNATPASYATLVHAYISAIRTVDPHAQFLGLPGVGQGAYGEPGWIRATVALNGPNLSGVAIHVYPAGGTVAGTATLGGFFATLNGSSSLSVRIPLDRAAVTAACPACGPLPILATELGSGTQGGAYTTYMTGFADVPYLATEAIQALSLNLSQIDLFAFQATYGGSLLNSSGSPSLAATLYEQFLSRLGPSVTATLDGAGSSGLSGVVTRSSNGSTYAFLVANTNLSRTFSITPQPFPGSGRYDSMLLTWNHTSALPQTVTIGGGALPLLVVPPESLALLVVNASAPGPHLVGGVAPAPWVGSAGFAVAGVLGTAVVAPIVARRTLSVARSS